MWKTHPPQNIYNESIENKNCRERGVGREERSARRRDGRKGERGGERSTREREEWKELKSDTSERHYKRKYEGTK